MPFYEYICPSCNEKFTLMRSKFSDYNKEGKCPDCGSASKRLMSDFSPNSALAPDAPERGADNHKEKMWNSKRKGEEMKIKNPDPLKSWREERAKTLGYGMEKWTQWANEEKAKEQKKKDYGEKWLGRES